jgi:hypothetical protein
VVVFISHARLRVHWAPGIPHALIGADDQQDPGVFTPRECEVVSGFGGLKIELVAVNANAPRS